MEHCFGQQGRGCAGKASGIPGCRLGQQPRSRRRGRRCEPSQTVTGGIVGSGLVLGCLVALSMHFSSFVNGKGPLSLAV